MSIRDFPRSLHCILRRSIHRNLKSLLKKITPTIILDYLNKKRYSKKHSIHQKKDVKKVFSDIYKKNLWGSEESVSGQGSSLDMSSEAVKCTQLVIEQLKPTSILDLPCGDFNWMQHVDLNGINYIGGDIVEELIHLNNKKHKANNIDFRQLDIIRDELPSADLIIVRDCFVHFSYEKIFQSIENIRRANCKYILTTTFNNQSLNYDIVTGDWRPINLCKKPFNFPEPLMFVEEYCPTKFKKDNRGKSLALWRIEDLP